MTKKPRSKPQSPRTGWSPTMEQKAGLDGRQVKCLIASEGHLWMRDYFDNLPSQVRARLANSVHNVCPACMDEEARRRERKTIEAIERQLELDQMK